VPQSVNTLPERRFGTGRDARLAALLEYFNSKTFTLRDSLEEGRRTVWMELHVDPKDTDDAIVRYGMVVESLPISTSGSGITIITDSHFRCLADKRESIVLICA
jgi:hypothetical protein